MSQYRVRLIWARQIITLIGIFFYAFWLLKGFVTENIKEAYGVEIRNKLPQTIDFYIIKVDRKGQSPSLLEREIIHSGKIRPEHYRLERMQVKNTQEFWLIGFLGRGNMVYFSRHLMTNKNIDAIIEIDNYIEEEKTLSEVGKKEVEALIHRNNKNAVWIMLSLLFLFINAYDLPKKWVRKAPSF